MPGRLMMTSYGWRDAGGGTTVPRLAARELARRGWEVTVFHASTQPTANQIPYELNEWDEDGVHLIGVHNRPRFLFDIGQPLRELDDPLITSAFPIRPDGPYGIGKAAGEAAGRWYADEHGLSVICLRIGTVELLTR